MPFLSDTSVIVTNYQGLPLKDAVEILYQCSAGLYHLHLQGIIHRDFRAANILLTTTIPPLHAVVADFGVSHQVCILMSPDSLGHRYGILCIHSSCFDLLCTRWDRTLPIRLPGLPCRFRVWGLTQP